LSSDGITALVGAPNENGGIGAAYVYVRRGGAWVLQQRLEAGASAPAAGLPEQGYAVALSADGNTAAVSGPYHEVVMGEPRAQFGFLRGAAASGLNRLA